MPARIAVIACPVMSTATHSCFVWHAIVVSVFAPGMRWMRHGFERVGSPKIRSARVVDSDAAVHGAAHNTIKAATLWVDDHAMGTPRGLWVECDLTALVIYRRAGTDRSAGDPFGVDGRLRLEDASTCCVVGRDGVECDLAAILIGGGALNNRRA
jgi:hypothetical protein